jgi:flagellar motor switch/type III secretory pathway protein FliN
LTQDHADWLPFDALTSPAITSAFEPAISAWSKRWFGDRPFELTRVRPQSGRPSLKSAKTEWRAFGHGIFIDWSEKTQLLFAEQGLHISTVQHKLSADDKGLMLALSHRILDDLVNALVDIVGHEAESNLTGNSTHPYGSDGGLELQIQSVSDGAIIMAGISSGALTRLRKKQCGHHMPKKMQTASVVDILGLAVVGYAAEIGRANMSAFELQNMVEGDVVVLNRPLTVPLDMLAESSGRLLFKAMLAQHEGCLALTAHEFEGSEA